MAARRVMAITGAGKGIGAAIARLASARGYDLITGKGIHDEAGPALGGAGLGYV